ncbi:hypothetical protein N7G274_007225 [Stereocaulon virgatum]|uniref:RNA helicase n=1 Tax=Stereocaulon virgatum TaxID=373712 RepID=A0ABR4A426_9LECA
MHVGPTNSGKTYQALKRLEQAKTGIYAGPLRLLAHEVYTRMNAKGRVCDLVTGDERAVQENAEMRSCTVEMVPLNFDVDVAVIDEIQMIGHKERGWAWTQAFLGLKAKEIHLCGEERSVPLVRELAASMGDSLEINTYKRLSPLKTMSTSLHGDLRNLRKGDCVVVFSRLGIRAMKADIERLTRRRVAVVYGSLPPEIRAQQAKLFNEPDNDYDFLVASDAIGMGLNLAIKRIVFEAIHKYNGFRVELIEPAHLKQIAGRAGRYRTAAQTDGPLGKLDENTADSKKTLMQIPSPNVGLVTTFERRDLPLVQRAMQTELDPIMSAGILPPTIILMKFATYFPPSTSFSYILLRLHELSLKHPRYHLCTLKEQIGIADTIQHVRLSIHDRIIFCSSPCSVNQPAMAPILHAYARCVGENTSGALLDIPEIPLKVLDDGIRLDRSYMSSLENLHKAIVLYLWLSYRFAGVFVDQAMAFYVKRLVEEKIDKMLAEYSSSPAIRERIKAMRKEALRQISKLKEPFAEPDDSEVQIEVPDVPLVPEYTPVQGRVGQDSQSAGLHITEQQYGIGNLAEANTSASPP